MAAGELDRKKDFRGNKVLKRHWSSDLARVVNFPK